MSVEAAAPAAPASPPASAGLVSLPESGSDDRDTDAGGVDHNPDAEGEDESAPPHRADKQKQVAKKPEDDPELEFPGMGKKKRSEWVKEFEKAKGLERAAHERNREASKIKQQAQQLWEVLGNDPAAVLKHRGIDPVKFAQHILQAQMEEHALTPEQRQARDIQRERDELKARAEQYEQREQERIRSEQEAIHTRQYENSFIEAIKAVGLRPDPVTVVRMAELTKIYLDQGLDVPASEVAAELKQREMEHRAILRSDISDDEIDAFVPPELQERIRQKYLKQARPQLATESPNQPAKRPAAQPRKASPYVDYDDYWRAKRERQERRMT